MNNKGWGLVEKGKASEEAGKYEKAISYYKKTGGANPFISVEGLISEVGLKFSSREEYEKWKAGRMRRVDKKRGMAKKIVLVCVICLFIGSALYLVPLHETQHIKANMSEVTNSMSNVASAVEAYHQEENTWPHCDGVIAIQNSLGVIFSKETTDRISSITVTSPTAEEVIITATIKGIDSRVDGKNLTLTGKPSERGILWIWGGTVPSPYAPKK